MKSVLYRFGLNVLWNEHVVEMRVLVESCFLSVAQVQLQRDLGTIALINNPAGKIRNELLLLLNFQSSVVYIGATKDVNEVR